MVTSSVQSFRVSNQLREKHELQIRVGRTVTILHTYAVAAGAGSVALLVAKGPNETPWIWLGFLVAIAFHAGSIYLAPMAPRTSE